MSLGGREELVSFASVEIKYEGIRGVDQNVGEACVL